MRSVWLLVCVLPLACAADDPLEYVGRMLENANWEMSRRKLQFLQFKDRERFLVLGELWLERTRLGNMSTLALLGPVQDQKFVLTVGPAGSSLYDFDLKVGLREMLLLVHYKLEVLQYGATGWVALGGQENALGLRGRLTVHHDRRCEVRLDWLGVGVFAGFQLELGPDSWARRLAARLVSWALRRGFPLYQDLLDQALRHYLLRNELFLAYLHEFMCYPFVVG